jgi:hypothetical protein
MFSLAFIGQHIWAAYARIYKFVAVELKYMVDGCIIENFILSELNFSLNEFWWRLEFTPPVLGQIILFSERRSPRVYHFL